MKGVLLGLFGPDGTSLANATFTLVQNLDYTVNKSYTINGPGNLSVFDASTGVWTPDWQQSRDAEFGRQAAACW